MKRFKIVFAKSFTLVFSLLFISFVSSCFMAVDSFKFEAVPRFLIHEVPEIREYWKPDINEDFDDSSVLVVMDKKTGGINKQHEESFFGSFAIEAIYDLSFIGDAKGNKISEDDAKALKSLDIQNFN